MVVRTHVAELQLVRGEYLEIPSLCLTRGQVQRFWSLDHVTSEALLAELVSVRFLRHTTLDTYVRADIA